jgi:hypothetical protein
MFVQNLTRDSSFPFSGRLVRILIAAAGNLRGWQGMRSTLLTALRALLPGPATAQPPATILMEPAGWRLERLPTPPPFVPGIKLTGFEEARFAPGMFDPSSDTYFTCVLVFTADGSPELDRAALIDFLEKYITGD